MEAHVPQVTHEAERFSRVAISLIAICVVVFSTILAVVAVVLANARTRGLETAVPERTAQPREVISNVRVDLFSTDGAGRALHAAQARRLSQYGWIDRQRGVVHVPIDVAMDLELAERH